MEQTQFYDVRSPASPCRRSLNDPEMKDVSLVEAEEQSVHYFGEEWGAGQGSTLERVR